MRTSRFARHGLVFVSVFVVAVCATYPLRAHGADAADAAPAGAESATAPEPSDEATPSFRLSLSAAEQMAVQYSIALRSARLDREVAEGKIMSAWSEALPVVSGSASKGFSDTWGVEPSPGGRDKWNKTYSWGVSVRQPLYTAGRAGAAIRSARLYRKNVKESFRGTRQDVIHTVRVNYYGLLYSSELVTVQREQVAFAKKYLDDVVARREADVATDFDVLRAEVEHTNEKTRLIGLENQLVNAESAFLRLLGLPLSAELELTDSLEYAERALEPEDVLVARAMLVRPDVASSELGIKMQNELLISTRAGLFPQVSMTGNYSRTNDDWNDGEWTPSWRAGVEISWTLFDGLGIRGKLKEFRARLAQLELAHKDLADQVRLDIRQALLDIESARKSVESQRRNVDQAEESLRLTVEGEKAGVNTYLDVLEARQALALARQNFQSALFDYNSALADLDLATGVIGEKIPSREDAVSEAEPSFHRSRRAAEVLDGMRR